MDDTHTQPIHCIRAKQVFQRRTDNSPRLVHLARVSPALETLEHDLEKHILTRKEPRFELTNDINIAGKEIAQVASLTLSMIDILI